MTASQPNQVIDQTRAMIQWAYSEQSGASGSIFEIFSGRQTKDTKLKPSRRTAGLSPTRVHATETQKSGKARIPIASGRSGGEIKRAVASLPSIEQSWIHLVYNPSRDRKEMATKILYPALWELYKSRHNPKGSHNRTMILTQYMLKIQLQQAHSYAGFTRWSKSRPEAMENAIKRPSWTDTFQDRWIAVRLMLEKVDNEALMGVYHRVAKKAVELAE